jgi:predicted ATPase
VGSEIKYREPKLAPIVYRLVIDDGPRGPIVVSESLRWRHGKQFGGRLAFLAFHRGEGSVIAGATPEERHARVAERLDAPDLLAASALGQVAAHPRVSAFRRFITGWYLSYISADDSRGIPEARPVERLSKTGDNLPDVMQYLAEHHEERLTEIVSALASRIPQLEQVRTRALDDGRLLLELKDAAFGERVLARWISDGH